MKMFPLNEFVKSLNLNNIGNDDVRKKVIKQILDALDHICPGSYMPYFFIAASGNNGLSLGPTSDKDKESLPYAQIISRKDFAPYLSEKESVLMSRDENHTIASVLSKGLKDIISCINDAEHPLYCWHFDQTSIFHWASLTKNDPLFTFFQIKSEDDADPIVMNTNKAAYFTLVCILCACLPINPDYDKSYDNMSEESLFDAKEEWLDFCDSLIMEYYCKRHPEYHAIPEGYCRIINGLFFDSQEHILYDPFNNLGQFALNVNAHMSEIRELQTPSIYLYDENDIEALLATEVRLALRGGLSFKIDFITNLLEKHQDSSSNPSSNPSSGFYLATMPPFSKSVEIKGESVDPIAYSIKKGLSIADNGGKMAIIVPSSVLINQKYNELRNILINNKHAVKFVLMPSGSLGTWSGIATVIIFVDGSVECDTVKFIDATNFVHKSSYHEYKGDIDYIAISNLCYYDSFPADTDRVSGYYIFNTNLWCPDEKGMFDEWDEDYYDNLKAESFDHDIKIVLKEEIRQNGYLLNPSFYFDHVVLAPEGFETKRLSDILVEEKEIVDDYGKGKIISAKDLHNNDSLIELSADRLSEDKAANPGGTLVYKIEQGYYILVSKVGRLCPTAIKVTAPVYVNRHSVTVYKIVSDSVIPAYLANEMRKDYFSEQLHYTKMVSGMLNNLVLSNLNIFVPKPIYEKNSIQLQQELFEKDILNKMGLVGEQLKRANDERFNEYIMALRQRKHRIAQILNQVCPAFNLLNRTREKNDGVLKDANIVATRTGENVAQYFGKVQQGLEKIERLVDTLVDKNQWGKPETFSMEDFINQFSQKHICKNYRIVSSLNNIVDDDSVNDEQGMLTKRMVNMPKDELSTVFENIIANAETWGFNDSSRTDYAVRISLGEIKDGDNVLVFIANNGTPIHPSVDREHIFDWGVGTHTGVGTWQVKNIVEHYGGTIRINEYPDAKDGFQTEYEISLPREY